MPPALHLPELLSLFLRRWRTTPAAAWVAVGYRPHADLVPEVNACGTELEAQIEHALAQLGATCRRLGRHGSVAFRCWQDDQTVRLEMTADVGLHKREWIFTRRPELGAGSPRRRRRRVILPNQPLPTTMRDWRRRGAPICLLSADPATVEMGKTLAAHFDLELWSTPSLRQARQWLVRHPGCPLLLTETQEPGGAPKLWLSGPGVVPGNGTACLDLPLQTSALFAAAGKIFRTSLPNAV